ncbi:hypothetical protein N7520_002435 [Penicillium odoratum]|uniref:uncharacterized protein n=1 Tax=Penicillium odoratum TaxID=1167516 RepID=UPI0025477F40|nr:uncharacterized protein N7520_002435 [Penicillium odoratum]KAJ5771906.1 hypothetical protein N7520_002435 [Penicillium odoratum]
MWTVLEPQQAITCANMAFFKTTSLIAPGMASSTSRRYGRSSERTFDRFGQQSVTNGDYYSMEPLDRRTNTVEDFTNFESAKVVNADVKSISSYEQRLASNAGPYGISFVQKFDVEYADASVGKICSAVALLYISRACGS